MLSQKGTFSLRPGLGWEGLNILKGSLENLRDIISNDIRKIWVALSLRVKTFCPL